LQLNFYAVRGAITIDKDEKDTVLAKTKQLLKEIIKQNKLSHDNIISIIFTATKDIRSVYPAVAAREIGMTNTPLICCQEMDVEGSLAMCIRVMMNIQSDEPFKPKHVYLEGAVSLRPDLTAKYTIAIDGPAGAGKSTIAKLLAKKLNIMYLDTGAMYRAFALKVLEAGLDPEVKTDVEKVVDQTEISIEYENGTQRVYLDKRDVTDEIRSEQVSKAASAVAVIPEVRKKLVQLQRRIAATNNLVMDGRDIGTYVLPDADLKIFLTASAEERARRRWSELRSRGLEVDFESVLSDIIKRDHNDSNREFAPLKKADDAVLIDTTDKSIQEVVEQIESLVDFRR